jgi:DNA ligase-1
MLLSRLADVYDALSSARSDSARARILADLFVTLDPKSLNAVAHLTIGELVDPGRTEALGIGPGMIRATIAELSGESLEEVDERIRRSGDLGQVASELVEGDGSLTVTGLWQKVNRAVEKEESRAALLRSIFRSADRNGIRYVVRMMVNQMRLSAGTRTIARALESAFGIERGDAEHLYAMTNDIGLVAVQARKGPSALARTGLALWRPYQFMNAQKMDDPAVIFARWAGKEIIFEVKYDGARLQIHIDESEPRQIRLYSRRLNDVTDSLPDVVEALRASWKGGAAIIEGEAVAYDRSLKVKQPFQAVLMRLGRKSDIEEKAREIPFILYLFDMLYDDGVDLMETPQRERRRRLNAHFRVTSRVKRTDSIATSLMTDQQTFFERAIESGHEGLMAKDPDATYLPGTRAENWLKIKPAFETLDVVVVGGIWGSGRRVGTLSSLIVAVRDGDRFLTVGKVGTGFTNEVLTDLTRKLEPLILSSDRNHVEIEPRIVIEVDFQGIQKTAAYESGYALRIPRFKRERDDKSVREADTLARLEKLFGSYT